MADHKPSIETEDEGKPLVSSAATVTAGPGVKIVETAPGRFEAVREDLTTPITGLFGAGQALIFR